MADPVASDPAKGAERESGDGETGEPGEQGQVRLARELTLTDATMLGVGALMGGGVFVLLGLAADVAGNAALLALFLNGLVTFPTLLVYAELSSTSGDAGGGYLWIRQGLGKTLGFFGGWIGWFGHAVACALYALAAAAFILAVADYAGWVHSLPRLDIGPAFAYGETTVQLGLGLQQAIALLLAALFVLLNYGGAKAGVRSENVVNLAVLLAIAAFIGAGLVAMAQRPEDVLANFTPFWREGGMVVNLSNVFLAMGLTFIAFVGYEVISQTSGEIQDPRRNIPRAIWYSFLIVWGTMLLVAVVALAVTRSPLGAQGWHHLGELKELGLVVVADQVLPYGTLLIAGAAILLQVTALNATLYSSSRLSFAMGRDGNLPRAFGEVHPTRRTPYFAVLGSGALVLAMALLPLRTVLASADVLFLLLFLLVNLAYIKLHKVIPQERFGFKARFFPYIPLFAIFAKFFLAVYLWRYEHAAWYITILWLALGGLFFFAYARHHQSAATPISQTAAVPSLRRGPRKDYRILALLSSPAPSTARSLGRTAGALAKSLDGELILLQPILVPEVTPLAEGSRFLQDQSLLNEARRAVPSSVPVQAGIRIGHNLDAVVREVVRDEGISLLLMSGQARATVGQPTSPLMAYPPCDVAILRLKNPDVKAQRVLLAVEAGVQASLGIRTGTALAKAFGGQLTWHNPGPGTAADRITLDQNAVVGVKTEVSGGEAGIAAVLDKARSHDLVIVGASVAQRPWRKGILGPSTQEVADRVATNVLIVLSGAGMGGPKGHWLGRRLLQIRRYFLPE